MAMAAADGVAGRAGRCLLMAGQRGGSADAALDAELGGPHPVGRRRDGRAAVPRDGAACRRAAPGDDSDARLCPGRPRGPAAVNR